MSQRAVSPESESSSEGASEQENNIRVSQSRAYFTPHLKHRRLPKDHWDQKLVSTYQNWQGSSVPLSKSIRPRKPRKTGNSSFQMKALQMLTEIRTKQLVLSEAVQRIENALSHLAPAIAPDSCDSTILKLLPLDSRSSLEKMEAELLVPKNRSDLVSYLSTIGGYSAKDCLRRIMRRIMADQLAQLYSFTGKKGKEPFSALRLLGVVIGAMRKTNPDVTDAGVQALVAEWLRYASARLKNRTGSSAQVSMEPDA